MKKNWHIGLLLAAGVLVIYFLYKQYPTQFASVLGDEAPPAPAPAGGLANTSAQNTTPGVNQTYNLPQVAGTSTPDSNSQYLTADQVNLTLAPAAQQNIQNIASVGADYAEFIPASQQLEG